MYETLMNGICYYYRHIIVSKNIEPPKYGYQYNIT